MSRLRESRRVPREPSSTPTRKGLGKANTSLQQEKSLLIGLLETLSQKSSVESRLRQLVQRLKEYSGCRCVGICLLDEDGSAPCAFYVDSAREAQESECRLCLNSVDSLCAHVIKGDADLGVPIYTDGGSFLTNHMTQLLASCADGSKGRRMKVGRRCGYESVALVPVKRNEITMGLIHLADENENSIPAETVRFLEHVGSFVGESVHRLMTERTLRRLDEDHSGLIGSVADAVFTLREGVVTWCNDGVERIYGCRREDMIGRKAGFFYPEHISPSEFTEAVFATIRERGVYRGTSTFQKKDGSVIDIEYSVSRLQGSEPAELVAVARDVSERSRMDEASRQLDEHYSTLLGNLADAVFTLREGVVTWCNGSVERVCGYKAEELIGRKASFFYPPDVSPSDFTEAVSASVRERGFFRTTSKFRRKDGSLADIEYSVSAVPGKRPIQFVVVARDASERRATEEALRRGEEYFRTLAENTEVMIAVVSSDGTLRYESPSVEQLLGHRASDRVGRSPLEFVHPDDVPQMSATFGEFLANKAATAHVELRIRHANGSWRTLEAWGRNLLADPAVKGIVITFRDVTDRKQAEKSLRESEEHYAALVANIADAVCKFRKEVVIWCNDNAERMFGYSKDELIGKKATFFYPSSVSPEEFTTAVSTAISKHGVFRSTAQFRRKDGSIAEIEYSITQIPNRRPVELVAVARDITARKRAEEELRNREEYFRSLAENALEVVVVVNRDGTLRYESPSMHRLLGHRPEERLGGNYLELIHPDDMPRAAHAFSQVVETPGSMAKMDLRIRHKNGSWRIIEAVGRNLLDHPVVSGIVANFHDVTERKLAEQALGESEQKYRHLVENLHEGVWLIDKDARTAFVNDRMADMLGYERDEMVGRHLFSFMDEHGVEIARRFLERRHQGIEEQHEFEFLRKDGRPLYALLATSAILDSDGSYAGAIAGVQDITERKRGEKALRESERELAIRNRIANVFLTRPDDEMYSRALQIILEAMESPLGIFGYIDENKALVCASIVGEVWEQCRMAEKTIVFPRETWGGVWGRALVGRKSLYVNEGLRVPEGHIPVQRILVVPIAHRRKVIGILEVANKAADYNEEDQRFLEAIAGHIAPVLSARLQREKHERTRKKAEEALRESEQHYSALVGNLAEAVFKVKDGVVTWCNEASEEVYGYSKEELIGKNASFFYPGSVSPEEFTRAVSAAIRSEGVFRSTTKFQKKDGSIAEIEYSISQIPDRLPPELVAIARDVTEHREAEKARQRLLTQVDRERGNVERLAWDLKREKDLLQIIVENTDANLAYLDPEFDFIWVNSAYARGSGHATEELIGQNHFHLFPSEENQRIFERVRDTGEPVEFRGKEFTYQDQPWRGTTYWDWTLTPVKDSSGTVQALVLSLVDVTERKRLEQLKDDFIGMVSHELRTPLTVIIGAVHTALTEEARLSSEDRQELLQDAAAEAESLSHLLGNLLDLSRSQADRLVLHVEPTSVQHVVENTVEKIKQLHSSHVFAVHLPQNLPLVRADHLRLERVLYNLIENAVKYSPQGSKIRVFARPDKKRVVIGVRDQGKGMLPEEQAQLFAPFQRLQSSRLDGTEGIGLGLLVCRRLVEAHGGKIWMESKPGHGTTVLFCLPLG